MADKLAPTPWGIIRFKDMGDGTVAEVMTMDTPGAYKAASGSVSVPQGSAFVTLASVTPAADVEVEGFNADIAAIVATGYRYRLITGTDGSPTVIAEENINSAQNSWIPVKLTVTAGTRIAVQAVHGEVTAQTMRGTVNYKE